MAVNPGVPEDGLPGSEWVKIRALADRFELPLPLAVALHGREYTPEVLGALGVPAAGLLVERTEALAKDRLHGLLEAGAAFPAAAAGGRIGILCDYDVDGGTAQAILVSLARCLGGKEPQVLVPERNEEGFGPNEALLARLDADVTLLCVLDCGTESEAMLARFAKGRPGLQILIVDHHPVPDAAEPPPGILRFNPAMSEDPGHPAHLLCTAGLAFLLGWHVLRGWVAMDPARREAALALYDRFAVLGAFGTVCDVMDLRGFNRSLVQYAAKLPPRTGGPGFLALCEAAACKEVSARAFGWELGPVVNAGSRLGESGLAAALLREESGEKALSMAKNLVCMNRARKDMTRAILEEFLPHLPNFRPPVVIYRTAIGVPGVAGIAAGNMVRLTGIPSIVLAPRPGGGWAGSGRSVPGVDLGGAVSAARRAGLLMAGGGHAMACGLEVKADEAVLQAFHDFMAKRLECPAPVLPLAEASLGGAMDDMGAGLFEALCVAQARLEPLGKGFALPRYQVRDANLSKLCESEKGLHVQGILGGMVPFVLFRQAGGLPALSEATGLPGPALLEMPDTGFWVSIEGTVGRDWKGKPQFLVDRVWPRAAESAGPF